MHSGTVSRTSTASKISSSRSEPVLAPLKRTQGKDLSRVSTATNAAMLSRTSSAAMVSTLKMTQEYSEPNLIPALTLLSELKTFISQIPFLESKVDTYLTDTCDSAIRTLKREQENIIKKTEIVIAEKLQLESKFRTLEAKARMVDFLAFSNEETLKDSISQIEVDILNIEPTYRLQDIPKSGEMNAFQVLIATKLKRLEELVFMCKKSHADLVSSDMATPLMRLVSKYGSPGKVEAEMNRLSAENDSLKMREVRFSHDPLLRIRPNSTATSVERLLILGLQNELAAQETLTSSMASLLDPYINPQLPPIALQTLPTDLGIDVDALYTRLVGFNTSKPISNGNSERTVSYTNSLLKEQIVHLTEEVNMLRKFKSGVSVDSQILTSQIEEKNNYIGDLLSTIKSNAEYNQDLQSRLLTEQETSLKTKVLLSVILKFDPTVMERIAKPTALTRRKTLTLGNSVSNPADSQVSLLSPVSAVPAVVNVSDSMDTAKRPIDGPKTPSGGSKKIAAPFLGVADIKSRKLSIDSTSLLKTVHEDLQERDFDISDEVPERLLPIKNSEVFIPELKSGNVTAPHNSIFDFDSSGATKQDKNLESSCSKNVVETGNLNAPVKVSEKISATRDIPRRIENTPDESFQHAARPKSGQLRSVIKSADKAANMASYLKIYYSYPHKNVLDLVTQLFEYYACLTIVGSKSSFDEIQKQNDSLSFSEYYSFCKQFEFVEILTKAVLQDIFTSFAGSAKSLKEEQFQAVLVRIAENMFQEEWERDQVNALSVLYQFMEIDSCTPGELAAKLKSFTLISNAFTNSSSSNITEGQADARDEARKIKSEEIAIKYLQIYELAPHSHIPYMFQFYSKSRVTVGSKAAFEEIAKSNEMISLSEFTLFAKHFGLLSILKDKSGITDVFMASCSLNEGSKELGLSEFKVSIVRLAELIYPDLFLSTPSNALNELYKLIRLDVSLAEVAVRMKSGGTERPVLDRHTSINRRSMSATGALDNERAAAVQAKELRKTAAADLVRKYASTFEGSRCSSLVPLIRQIFLFYSKSQLSVGTKAAFEEIQHQNDTLSFPEYTLFLKHFELSPKYLSKKLASELFVACAGSDESATDVSWDEFKIAICRMAEIIFPEEFSENAEAALLRFYSQIGIDSNCTVASLINRMRSLVLKSRV